ncbi:MAG: diguanylate cyclase [Thermoleophilia bacterium]|nr:diguanylate cyclase [Thermoleophilia bacterium]
MDSKMTGEPHDELRPPSRDGRNPVRFGLLRRGGPILTRARRALAFKLVVAAGLTGSMLLELVDAYLGLLLATAFVLITVLLDYWVYRAVNDLFTRIQNRNQVARVASEVDALHAGLEQLIGGVRGRFSGLEALEVETIRSDLYRLRDFNNQLLRLGEIAQELNAALPYRETKMKALGLSRQLLSADIVALVAEDGGEFTLGGVAGCEEGEIKVDCCGYYARCPMRASFRDRRPATAADHTCLMFPPTMRAQISLPFKLDGRRTMSLLAAAAQPRAFEELSSVVLETLVGHVQTSLSTALKYDRIRREVVTDPLTNLYNRRFFEKRAREEVARALRHQQPVTLLMLDVDRFKSINDVYGHQTGDKVLQTVAKHLRDSVRQSDICGRYGGEEFVLLLPNTPGRNAVFLADRLRSGVGDIMYTGLGIPGDVAITISGGVATCPRDATTLEELVGRADTALYEAKNAGRNRIVQAGIPDPPLEPEYVEPPQPRRSGRRVS